MLRAGFSRLCRSRLACRIVFGVRAPALEPGEHLFDAATLALRRACRREVPRGARVLELGTGSAAVLGLWLLRSRGCRVECTELDARIAGRARESVRRNGASLAVRTTHLFEGLQGEEYDVVVFNPPYVPTEVGVRRGLPEAWRSQWDGGPDGTATIAAFAAAFRAWGGAPVALVGVNARHVPRERAARAIGAPDGALRARRDPWLPVDVYRLVRTKSPIASTSSPLE